MTRHDIVTREIGHLCTDWIDLQFIEDVYNLLPHGKDTWTLLDRAQAVENSDWDLERHILHLDFFQGKAEKILKAAGYQLDWDDSQYVIFREN